MTAEQPVFVRPPAFELRMSLLYAAVYISLGVHLPYFPVWLEANGFGPEQIGLILSLPMFVRVVTTPVITALADRVRDRVNVLIAIVLMTVMLSFGYFLPPTYAIVLGVSMALAVVWPPHGPLTDSLALSGVRRFGSVYPRMRIWGSISFLTANFGGGLLLGWMGAGAVPVMISVGLTATLVASFLAPRLGRPRRASPLSAAELPAAAPKLLNAPFLYFIAGVGAINASHNFQYGFVSIYWKSIGLADGVIGFLWAWSVLTEVGIFAVFTRLFGRISAQTVLGIAATAAIVRWMIFPQIAPLGLGVPGFFAVQSLHALSTGLLLIGLQKLIAEQVPEERTGAAQGMAFFANGFAMASVTLVSGPLYERFGVGGFYAMAAVALLGLILIGLSVRSTPKGGRGRKDQRTFV